MGSKLAEQAPREAHAVAEAPRRREAQRRQDAAWRKEIADSLRGVLAALNSKPPPLQDVLQHIVHQVGHLLGSEAAAVYGLDRLMDGPPPPTDFPKSVVCPGGGRAGSRDSAASRPI